MIIIDEDKLFSVNFSNIPLINLRLEFKRNYEFISNPNFSEYFKGPLEPIKTPYFMWYGMPNDLLTLLLQRTILGLESYVLGAVFIVLGNQNRLSENIKYINNPYNLKGRGTVNNYYHKLPGLINKDCSLKTYDKKLWNITKKFYAKIRNPIFHGKQLSKENPEFLLECYKLIDNIYNWTEDWYPLDNLMSG